MLQRRQESEEIRVNIKNRNHKNVYALKYLSFETMAERLTKYADYYHTRGTNQSQ